MLEASRCARLGRVKKFFEVSLASTFDQTSVSPLGLAAGVAAIAWWDGISVRARLRMAKECADLVVEFGADDVFELAGLCVRFGIFYGKCVFEEPLGQAMAPHNVASPSRAGGREFDVSILQTHQLKF